MANTHHNCLSLLKSCKTLRHLKQVHAFISKTGLDSDTLTVGKIILISSITVADGLNYACRLFSQFPNPDAFMYNTLIRGFSESKEYPHHSFLIFNQMRRHFILLDSFSFAFLLKAMANFRSLDGGTQLHSLAIRHSLDTHIFVGTTLVSLYAECGCIGSAMKIFDEIPNPNVVSWNAIVTACLRAHDVKGAEYIFSLMPMRDLTSYNLMLAGYTKAGEFESARRIFSGMPERDPVSWSTMISGFTSNGNVEYACRFFKDLLREGPRPNEVSLTSILAACAQLGALENGKILHGYISKSGFTNIIAVTNALLDMYSRCGSIEMAYRVFIYEMGKNKNNVSWTSMIAAFAVYGYGEKAIEFFNNMVEFGANPDEITFTSLLYACSQAGLINQGHVFFHKMQDVYRIAPSVEHYGCMVDLYGRAGLLEEAYSFAIEMPIEPNAIIWRTLLGACTIHGNVELAERVKKRLAELDPNDSSDYVSLSNVYALAGKWKDVVKVRESMSKQYLKKDPGWSSI